MWRTKLLLTLAFLLLLSAAASAQVKWVKHINPTSGEDYGYGACLFGNYLVVVGEASGSPFLALLDRESGEVVKTWSRGSGAFTNCIAVGDRLYVVGYVVEEQDWYYQIYEFDKNLNVLIKIGMYAGFEDIVYQGGYFYIGGRTWKYFGGKYWPVWYIKKMASDLSLVAHREIYDVNWEDSDVYNVGVNPVTGDVWAVGYYKVGGVEWPLVAILDKDLNLKRLIQLPNYTGFFGWICFDREGNAYVSGNNTTIKFDKNGNYIKRYGSGGSTICIKDRLYVFGHITNTTVPIRRLGYDVIDMTTMEGIREVDLPASSIDIFNLTSFYAPGKPCFDGQYIYSVGVLYLGYKTGGGTVPIKDTEIVVFAVPVVSTVKVVNSSGRPLAGFYVRGVAGGYSLVNSTGADGVAQFWGLAPDTVYVFDRSGRLVWAGNVTSLDATVTVRLAQSIPATSPVDLRGYLVLKRVLFLDGSTRDVRYGFQLANGVLTVDGDVPLDLPVPVEVYVTEFSIGSTTLVPRGGAYLAYSGTARDLVNGLNFGNLFTRLEVSAVDSTGAARSDWTVQLIYQGAVLAEGKGSVSFAVPRTSVLGQPYVVKVVTTALAPDGSAAAREQLVSVEGDRREVRIAVNTTRVTVFAVDGFGQRRDWPVEIENVARGVGYVSAELLVGSMYTAKAAGLGFTNVTKFVARSPEMSVAVKIPTARLTARVVDGFGNVRSDWPVEVVGVASGQGSVAAEVLAGRYTVRATAFGREFVREVEVPPGQDVTATVQVPTARLRIYVVDDDRKPIDQYVTSVEVVGPVAQSFSRPPGDIEVLAGQYTVTVTALGKLASSQTVLQPGQYATVEVLVPGTAGIDIGGTRITYSTLYTILGVAVAVAVVGFAVAKLRSKGRGAD